MILFCCWHPTGHVGRSTRFSNPPWLLREVRYWGWHRPRVLRTFSLCCPIALTVFTTCQAHITHLSVSSCWSITGNMGRSIGISNPAWPCPRVRCQRLFRLQVPCSPGLHCIPKETTTSKGRLIKSSWLKALAPELRHHLNTSTSNFRLPMIIFVSLWYVSTLAMMSKSSSQKGQR